MQMHLHALSNHNASDQPASMQWHTWYARAAGIDVLWWSEHAEIFAMTDTFRIETARGIIDSATLFVSGLGGTRAGAPGGRKRGVVGLAAESDGGGVHAEFRDGYLYAEARSDARDTRGLRAARDARDERSARENSDALAALHTSRLAFRPVSADGPIRLLAFARPVTFGAIVEADVDLSARDDARRVEFRFPLSWHNYGAPLRYEIRYRLVPEGERASAARVGDEAVLVTMPVRDGRSTVRFDLEEAARLLRDGDVATIAEIEWSVEASGADPARVGVSGVRVWTKRADAAVTSGAARAIAARYEAEYGVREEFGGEFAWGSTHLNAFFPDSSLGRAAFDWRVRPLRPEQVRAWVEGVHARGGVVSFNHPFGTSFAGSAGGDGDAGEGGDGDGAVGGERAHDDADAADAATAPDSAADALRVRDLADDLIATGVYGCDVLEVGYMRRGGGTLADHLALWDRLTANRCFVYANGTSDSHGGPWFGAHNPNWFVTWIRARDASPEALIDGVKAGRLYFGDRSRWNGEFDVQLGMHRAGDRVAFVPRELDLRVTLDPIPEGAEVRLVRGAIYADADVQGRDTNVREVDYIDRATIIDPSKSVRLRIDRPCFVRVEVYLASAPLLFSNPIVFY
ncbi:MAG: hypothetical protein ACKVU1_12130 [bacterium]